MMERRQFLKNAGAGLLALPAALGAQSAKVYVQRDKFGGCPAIQFDATGFFRLEKRDRWWFVTPEGNAFLSLGMNHVHPGWLNQAYNAERWIKAFGAKRAFDSKWRVGIRAKVVEDLNAFGYNTLGVHNSHSQIRPRIETAWVKPLRFIDMAHWRDPEEMEFPDVFAEGFEKHCDNLAAKECALLKNDPWLLGYAMTDCPIFTEIDAAARPTHVYGSERAATRTWPRMYRNLPASSPGKRAYVDFMRNHYSNWILHFNEVYETNFESWDHLLRSVSWRPETDLSNGRELADNRAFLGMVVDKYYSVMTKAVRKHDPNHLIFGDKLNANTDSGDAVVGVTSKYTDLVFYQMYGRWQEQRPVLNRWSKLTDKPFVNGDGAFHAPHANIPNPHGPHAVDQEHRAELAQEFCERMFARKDFVGWHVCGWVETWKSMPKKQIKQHGGIQDPFGRNYEPLRTTLDEFSRRMYRVASRR